jgi:hypothetical protein
MPSHNTARSRTAGPGNGRVVTEENAPLLDGAAAENESGEGRREGAPADPNVAKHQISRARGACVVLGMALMILINGGWWSIDTCLRRCAHY